MLSREAVASDGWDHWTGSEFGDLRGRSRPMHVRAQVVKPLAIRDRRVQPFVESDLAEKSAGEVKT